LVNLNIFGLYIVDLNIVDILDCRHKYCRLKYWGFFKYDLKCQKILLRNKIFRMRPDMKNNFKIWPAGKNVWPPWSQSFILTLRKVIKYTFDMSSFISKRRCSGPSQFHQHFMWSFYARRSQKRKKYSKADNLLCTFGICGCKSFM